VKVENFSVSETLLATFFYIEYRELGKGKFTFTKLLAQDALQKGQQTYLTNENVSTGPIPTTPSPRRSSRRSRDDTAHPLARRGDVPGTRRRGHAVRQEATDAASDPFAEGADPFDVSAFDQVVAEGEAQDAAARLEMQFGATSR